MISALFKTERNNNSALNSVLNFNILVYILTLTVNSQQQILFFCQDTRCFYWICPIDCLNITPKMLVFFHTTVCLKLNCLWKLFNVQVLSELNGISAMFFFCCTYCYKLFRSEHSQYLLQTRSHWRPPRWPGSCSHLLHKYGSDLPGHLSPGSGHSPHAAQKYKLRRVNGEVTMLKWVMDWQIKFPYIIDIKGPQSKI